MPQLDPEDLSPDDMLIAEFNYIAQTAFQANEDRARVTSFYFVSVGSLVAALLGSQFAGEDLQNISLAFFVLFLVLTALGVLTIIQLARLRASWHESAEAMNTIKEFYIKNYPALKPAFKWHKKTIPPTDKPYSIANLMAIEVSILGALTASASAFFLLQFFGVGAWWVWLIIGAAFLIGVAVHWSWYKRRLVDDR